MAWACRPRRGGSTVAETNSLAPPPFRPSDASAPAVEPPDHEQDRPTSTRERPPAAKRRRRRPVPPPPAGRGAQAQRLQTAAAADQGARAESMLPQLCIAGQRVDALGSDRMWAKARIIAVDSEASRVKVHYLRFAATYDEWIPTLNGEDPRLAVVGTVTDRPTADDPQCSPPVPSDTTQIVVHGDHSVQWVQCEAVGCGKWRRLPPGVVSTELPQVFECFMAHWMDPATCEVPEDQESEEEEQQPSPKRQKNAATSEFVGVSWRKADRKWTASIKHSGKHMQHLGHFDDVRKAARAYDVAARRLRGDDAHGGRSNAHCQRWRLNFPTQREVQRAKERGALLTEEDKAAAAAASERQGPSEFVGVGWRKDSRKWTATIRIMRGGKNQHLGCFDDERDAARAVDTAARRLRGEDAHGGLGGKKGQIWRLNFPTQREVERAQQRGALPVEEGNASAAAVSERQEL